MRVELVETNALIAVGVYPSEAGRATDQLTEVGWWRPEEASPESFVALTGMSPGQANQLDMAAQPKVHSLRLRGLAV